MKSKPVKILLLLIGAVICAAFAGFYRFFCVPDKLSASAETDYKVRFGNVIVTAVVSENKVVSVSERLNAAFLESGEKALSRDVLRVYSYPKNEGGRKGKNRKFIAKVRDISASTEGEELEIKSFASGDYCRINIYRGGGKTFDKATVGQDGKTENTYTVTLNYTYDLSDSAALNPENFVFLFFNQKSYTQFNGSKLYVRVTMPKPFDGENAHIFDDKLNEWTPDTAQGEEFKIFENTVYATASIGKSNYFTLQIGVPEGYFSGELTRFNYYWIFFGVAMFFIVAGGVLAVIFRAKRPIYAVEFAPPELNPLHFSAFWHGYARRRDVCTVVLQWAHLGCVRISRDGEKDIILTKLKALPEDRTVAEQRYFAALFSGSGVFSSKALKLPQNKRQAERISTAANGMLQEAKSPQVHAKAVPAVRAAVALTGVLALLATLIYSSVVYDGGGSLGLVLVALAILLPVGVMLWFLLFFDKGKTKELRRSKPEQFFIMMLAIGATAATFGAVLIYNLARLYIIAYDYAYLLVLAVAWLVVCVALMPRFIARRTEEAQRFYGRMLGFKRFITAVELPRVEALVRENPEYYYEIMPYCLIMGISKKVERQFRYLRPAVPEWADGFSASGFALSVFYRLRKNVKLKKYREK